MGENFRTSIQLRKILILYHFLILTLLPISAQSQKTGQWVRQLGGRSWDITSGIVCDSKNNIYISGSFYSTIISDEKKADSKGNQDAFIAKFNQKGINELKSFGGSGMDLATSICILPDEKIVVSGIISDSAVFGKLKIKGKGKNLYVVKCDDNLIPLWLTCLSFIGEASISYSSTDGKGNIYVTGYFTDKIQTESYEVNSVGEKDIFIAILDQKGSVLKLSAFGSEEDDFPTSFTVDYLGNMVLAGVLGKNGELYGLKFKPSENGVKINAFIASFDNKFSVKWIQQIFGNDYCDISSLGLDKSGNIYGTGTYTSKLIFPDTTFLSKGYTDGFILKLKSDGSYKWRRTFGSWYYDTSKQVNVNNIEGVILSGSIGDKLIIDSIEINPELKNNSSLFLQFDSSGTAIWGDCISGTGNSSSIGSVLDKDGNLYFTGYFKDGFQKGNSSFVSVGDQDIFLMKYENCFDENYGISGDLTFCPGLTTSLKVKRSYSNVIWNDTLKGKYTFETGKAGLYWVSAIDEKGCIISDSVNITESKLPIFSFGRDTTISLTDSIILKAPSLYRVHHWQDLSFEPEYLVKSSNGSLDDKIVWLMVKDSLECSFVDTITIHFTKAIREGSPENYKIIVYPNPAHDQILWSFISKAEVIVNFTLEIINDKGVKLKHEQIKDYTLGEEREINISTLLPGNYYLRISDSSTHRELKSIGFLKH